MLNLIDLTGRRFGRLIVLERVANVNRRPRWRCVCDCGNTKETESQYLLTGKTRSCGCIRKEIAAQCHSTHGLSKSPTYSSWVAMLNRCYRPAERAYKYYGEKGITVCIAWRDSFEAFLADMGLRPSLAHSLDRIDNNIGYEPSNCRWSTKVEQARNKTTNTLLTFQDETLCIEEWATRLDISPTMVRKRVARGWTAEDALTIPAAKDRENSLTPYSHLLDLTGQVFGRWTVLERSHSNKNGWHWKCQCSCGGIGVVSGNILKRGESKSCGCLNRELSSKRPSNYLDHRRTSASSKSS